MKPNDIYMKTIKNNLVNPDKPRNILDGVLNIDTEKIINKKIEQIIKDPYEKYKKEKVLKILSKLDDPYAKKIFNNLNKKWGLEFQINEISEEFDREKQESKKAVKVKKKKRKSRKPNNKWVAGSTLGLLVSTLAMAVTSYLGSVIGVIVSWTLIAITAILLILNIDLKK